MVNKKIRYTKPLVNIIADTEDNKKVLVRLAKRAQLTNIFEVTKAYCKANNKLELKTRKLTFTGNLKIVSPGVPTISVVNQDCIEAAKEKVLLGRTCMLNMANAVNRGGGVERGAMAQEEELCRRSNLWYGLRPSYYPMIDTDRDTDLIYTKNVKFFRNKYYEFEEEFNCDVLTIAAPCLIGFSNGKYPKNYSKIVEKKIRAMLSIPEASKVKHLILSAFGCGAFRNNPIFISRIFKQIISEGLPYESITFAILDDNNSQANGISNFETFKKTFKI